MQPTTPPELYSCGDMWFVNHQRVLHVTPSQRGITRMVHHTNGSIVPLKPTDVVRCRKAPIPKPGEPSPLPVFDVNTNRPVNTTIPRFGVGFTPKKKQKTSEVQTGEPSSTPTRNVHISLDCDTPPTHAVRKRISFADPLTVGPVVRSGNGANDDAPAKDTQHEEDGTLKEVVDDVPEVMDPEEACLWLREKDCSGLEQSELAGLLWHASGFQPEQSERANFYTWWHSEAWNLGPRTQWSEEVVKTFTEAAELLENACRPPPHVAYGPPPGLYSQQPQQQQEQLVTYNQSQVDTDMLYADLPPENPNLFQGMPDPANTGNLGSTARAGPSGSTRMKVTIPIDRDDATSYPACSADYDPVDPNDITKFKTRWTQGSDLAMKAGQKAEDPNKITDPLQYVNALIANSRQILTKVHINKVFLEALDPYGEMLATLSILQMHPSLVVRIQKHMPTPPTTKALHEAVDLELSSQLDIPDYYNNITKSRITTNFRGGGPQFPAFLQEFQLQWDKYAAKIGFTSTIIEENRKLSTFYIALPYRLQNRYFTAVTKQFKDQIPPSWSDAVKIARESNDELQKEDKAADEARQRNTNPFSPGRGGGGGGRGWGRKRGRASFGRGPPGRGNPGQGQRDGHATGKSDGSGGRGWRGRGDRGGRRGGGGFRGRGDRGGRHGNGRGGGRGDSGRGRKIPDKNTTA
jgi:hypothetical protein